MTHEEMNGMVMDDMIILFLDKFPHPQAFPYA